MLEPVSARSLGGPGTAIVFTTLRVFGSMRVTVLSPVLAVQTEPSPNVIAVGADPIGIWPTIRFVLGSITPTELGATLDSLAALLPVSSTTPAAIPAASRRAPAATIIRAPFLRRATSRAGRGRPAR